MNFNIIVKFNSIVDTEKKEMYQFVFSQKTTTQTNTPSNLFLIQQFYFHHKNKMRSFS